MTRSSTDAARVEAGFHKGTLVYASRAENGNERTLEWVDRGGSSLETFTLPFALPYFHLSPEGSALAIMGRRGGAARITVFDLARKALNDVVDLRLDYPSMPLWSRDGRSLIYAKGGQGKAERWSHRLDASKPDRRVLKTTSVFWAPSSLSPDGPFLAYIAADPVSGIANSYVLDLQSGKMAITVRPGPPASFDTPRAWFDREFVGGIDLGRTWEVSRAGRRFLLMRGSRVLAQSREIVVVQNWFEELRRLAPVPR